MNLKDYLGKESEHKAGIRKAYKAKEFNHKIHGHFVKGHGKNPEGYRSTWATSNRHTQAFPFNTIKDAYIFLRGATVKNNRQEEGKIKSRKNNIVFDDCNV